MGLEEYGRKLQEVGDKISQTRVEKLEVYFDEIRREYLGGDSTRVAIIESHLEDLIHGFFQPRRLKKIPSRIIFDSKKAEQIRIQAGYKTQVKLGKELGHDNGLIISKFERGLISNKPLRNKKNLRYLEWLKEQGYNPYGI